MVFVQKRLKRPEIGPRECSSFEWFHIELKNKPAANFSYINMLTKGSFLFHVSSCFLPPTDVLLH